MRDRSDPRYPFVEWLCQRLEAVLEGTDVTVPRPNFNELTSGDSETLRLVEQALDKLPPLFPKGHLSSVKERTAVAEAEDLAASLVETTRLASQVLSGAKQ